MHVKIILKVKKLPQSIACTEHSFPLWMLFDTSMIETILVTLME